MNANELAEDLEGAKLVILRLNDMLRQQQAEIEALNSIKYVNGTTISKLYAEIEVLKAKTLTDFEIRGVMALDECWVGEDCSIPDMIAFARAILREASE